MLALQHTWLVAGQTLVLPGSTELAVYAAWLPDSFLAVAVLSGAVPS